MIATKISYTDRAVKQRKALSSLSTGIRRGAQEIFDESFKSEKINILCNYKLGQLISTILAAKFNSRSRPPESLILNLCESLGKKRAALYRCYNVTLFYSLEEINSILEKAYANKTMFYWNFLVALAKLKENKKERVDLENSLINKELGATRLFSRINEIINEDINGIKEIKVDNDVFISDVVSNLTEIKKLFFSFRIKLSNSTLGKNITEAVSDILAGITSPEKVDLLHRIKTLCGTLQLRLKEIENLITDDVIPEKNTKVFSQINNYNAQLAELMQEKMGENERSR